jgi:hypothetical protein
MEAVMEREIEMEVEVEMELGQSLPPAFRNTRI